MQHLSTGPMSHQPERLLILIDPCLGNHFRTADEVVLQPKLVRKVEDDHVK